MGMGSTTFGMLQDPRVDSVITVELCSEQYGLLEGLADDGRLDFQRMFSDPRYDARTGDGRMFLLADDERYDIVTVDTLRPTSAFSGSLYSREFYELIAERLDDDGIVAQWVASGRRRAGRRDEP
jgi:spermidine synthase